MANPLHLLALSAVFISTLAQALLDRTHVGLDMVVDLEAVFLQMRDPLFAAAAIGIAVHIDGHRLGGLGQGGEEQGAQGEQVQGVGHGGGLVSYGLEGG